MEIDVNGFFLIFVAMLFIGIAIFWFYNSDFEFECPLPNGGYYRIHWIKETRQFRVFHWQPGENAKPLPKDAIILRSSKKEEEKK